MARRRGIGVHIESGPLQCGFDEKGAWAALRHKGQPDERINLPGWDAGGMELAFSRDERYAALMISSGQSSQGFEVFELEPTLRRIGGLPETPDAEGPAPVFSPSGRWLVSLLASGAIERDSDEVFEDIHDPDDDTPTVVDWADLYVMQLPEPAVTRIPVGAEIPRSTDVELVMNWNTLDAVRFIDENTIALVMPWGERLTVELPRVEPLTARQFGARPMSAPYR